MKLTRNMRCKTEGPEPNLRGRVVGFRPGQILIQWDSKSTSTTYPYTGDSDQSFVPDMD
jgi:quercetin dioxygenase-like cupin family protein